MDFCLKPVYELCKLLSDKVISPVELTEEFWQRVNLHNEPHPAFSTISSTAMKIHAATAEQVAQSDHLPLNGIPVAVDDLIEVSNLRTSFGSKVFESFVPEVDSLPIRRLKQAGAYVQGKTITAEFGILSEDSSQLVNSPFGEYYSIGGGSVGAAVAVAKDLTTCAICIDVGGNAILPAALSGVFAFRPTHGAIPISPAQNGVMGVQDVVLITKEVQDAALLMNQLAGFDPVDPHSLNMASPDYQAATKRTVRPLRIAYVSSLWNAPMEESQKQILMEIVSDLRQIGCRVERQRPPVRNPIQALESIAAANLYSTRADALNEGVDLVSRKIQELLVVGKSMKASDLIQAQGEIHGLRTIMHLFFKDYDLLLTPTCSCLPFTSDSLPEILSRAETPNSLG